MKETKKHVPHYKTKLITCEIYTVKAMCAWLRRGSEVPERCINSHLAGGRGQTPLKTYGDGDGRIEAQYGDGCPGSEGSHDLRAALKQN